jgi:hypothetical protein
MSALTAADYAKLDSQELLRRYKRLQADTSAMTMEAELQRQFAMQEIGEVLFHQRKLSSTYA